MINRKSLDLAYLFGLDVIVLLLVTGLYAKKIISINWFPVVVFCLAIINWFVIRKLQRVQTGLKTKTAVPTKLLSVIAVIYSVFAVYILLHLITSPNSNTTLKAAIAIAQALLIWVLYRVRRKMSG